jgi:Predicted amino acid racemase
LIVGIEEVNKALEIIENPSKIFIKMFPRINIYLDRIYQNAKKLKGILNTIEIMCVSKGVCGDPFIAKEMLKGGVDYIGDSRIENIIKMRRKGIESKIFQIRSPQLSEIRKQ